MSLTALRERYRRGEIAKADYIREMHRLHRLLFEYGKLTRETDVARIEIDADGVVATMRESGIRMLCDPDDERIAPIEILNFGAYEPTDARMMTRLFAQGGTLLMLTVFDEESSLGLVQLYFKEFAAAVSKVAPALAGAETALAGDFEKELNKNLAAMFGRG